MLSGFSLTLLLVGIVSYLLLRSIYRLYFHPLSKLPGPKIAAVTHLYEFYYDVIRNGMYIWEIEKMHVKYGPIVRINPREVHIKDPPYYEEIYASGTRKRDKDPAFVVTYTAPHSMISTTDHDPHRFRRSLLNPFFSKKSILHLSSVIEERVQKLMERFGESHENRSVIELDAAFAGLTADIIMRYCCGQSWGFLEDENFKNDFRNAVNEGVAYIHIFRFFPLLAPMLRLIPQRLLCQVQAGRASIYELQRWVYEQSIASVGPEQNQKKSTSTTCRTIFDALTDPAIPADERTLGRLQDEGLVILCAGTETTARALTLAAFHLTREPSMMLKLREELRQVMPTPNSPITWPQLESLPYLTGVVNEALRLSHGLVTRLPRIAPTEALRYNDYLIPPGTPVSTSSYFVHLDPLIFPHPHSFMPERWLLATEKGEKLNRFLVSFTKGSRACLGMNLAYAELYYTISRFARRFDLELYQTTLHDIRIVRDLGFGLTKNGDLKVRARITGVVQA